MDRTSDKQWLHDISHVGMRMGQSCQREQRNQGTRRKLFSEFPTDSSRSTIWVDAKHLVCMRVVLTHQ